MSRYELYLSAFIKVTRARIGNEMDKQLIKQNVFLGVKLISMLPDSKMYDEAVNNFQLASAIKQLASLLTPKEFVTIFPIDKDFKGHKYGMKDYFYTRGYISTLVQDKPIGEKITEFLWEYTNLDISLFSVKLMGLMSDIRRFEGKPSIAEEWAEMNGIETYSLHTDHEGKQYMMDKQGRTQKVVKPRPKHLRLVQ